jgi:hypothetical protein
MFYETDIYFGKMAVFKRVLSAKTKAVKGFMISDLKPAVIKIQWVCIKFHDNRKGVSVNAMPPRAPIQTILPFYAKRAVTIEVKFIDAVRAGNGIHFQPKKVSPPMPLKMFKKNLLG